MTSLNIIIIVLLLFGEIASAPPIKSTLCTVPFVKGQNALSRRPSLYTTRLRTYVGHYVKTECQSTVSVTEAITEVGR